MRCPLSVSAQTCETSYIDRHAWGLQILCIQYLIHLSLASYACFSDTLVNEGAVYYFKIVVKLHLQYTCKKLLLDCIELSFLTEGRWDLQREALLARVPWGHTVLYSSLCRCMCMSQCSRIITVNSLLSQGPHVPAEFRDGWRETRIPQAICSRRVAVLLQYYSQTYCRCQVKTTVCVWLDYVAKEHTSSASSIFRLIISRPVEGNSRLIDMTCRPIDWFILYMCICMLSQCSGLVLNLAHNKATTLAAGRHFLSPET